MKLLIVLFMLGIVVQISYAEVEADQNDEIKPNKKDVIFEIMKKFYNSKLTSEAAHIDKKPEKSEKHTPLEGEKLTLAFLKKTEKNWDNLQESMKDFVTKYGSLPERLSNVQMELKELLNAYNLTTPKP
ncbi:uncharacterized protein LOC26534633 [Drosophila yakuba]|uniref:Uncharacterized protein n=1 Tax=Drosophila yakuba TaxID=7245 RepID=A0A0R1EAQ0_DROYA|nr:uncharacterized protein LOC26534633 [Drosophila yakuba]KRK04452.1 uncharacterized protein Dyak_GE27452 [Drosophila yakuba]